MRRDRRRSRLSHCEFKYENPPKKQNKTSNSYITQMGHGRARLIRTVHLFGPEQIKGTTKSNNPHTLMRLHRTRVYDGSGI